MLTNSYIKEVPAVAMTFKQKNAGVDSLQVGKGWRDWGGLCCGSSRRVPDSLACTWARGGLLACRLLARQAGSCRELWLPTPSTRHQLAASRSQPTFAEAMFRHLQSASLNTPLAAHACHLPLVLLQCMVGKCGGQIFACMADSTCRTSLNCLSACEFNDQVGG